MKKNKVLLALLVGMVSLFLCVGSNQAKEQAAEEISILFTHDLHSYLDVTTVTQGNEIGGFGKIKTFIQQKKDTQPATVVVDGGDFSMGTLYQTIYETDAAELTMLGQMGYDATTIGNHEFDYRGVGFANMLESAVKHGKEDDTIKLPALLNANIDWEKNNTKENQKVKKALDLYGSTAYTVIEREGIKIGIFGVMGKDAEACAPESGITFEDTIDTSKKVVEKLKEENVDLIICLSHSGTWEDIEKSEDEQLAKAVPEIDVIVSGHTHTVLSEPITYKQTQIVSAGCYGANMGEIVLDKKEDGRWEMVDYQIHPMDSEIKTDETVAKAIEKYKEKVNQNYLKKFGYTYDQVIANNTMEFGSIESILATRGETKLGNLLSDSYIYAVQKAEGAAHEPIDAAIVPSGIVRATLKRGKITVGDVFEVSSLGIGPDRVSGYPLVSVYLTGKELQAAAEVDASISPMMDGTELFPSGIGWEYNPNRLLLNRVTDIWKITGDGKQEAIQDDKLYRVIADLYSAQMLGAVKGKSYGLLSLVPKDKDGNEIVDFEKQIIYTEGTTEEVKEWVALANYLESFEKVEGISTIPVKYEELQGRKIVKNSNNIVELLKHPNKVFFIVIGIVFILILLIALIIKGIKYTIKRAKRRKI